LTEPLSGSNYLAPGCPVARFFTSVVVSGLPPMLQSPLRAPQRRTTSRTAFSPLMATMASGELLHDRPVLRGIEYAFDHFHVDVPFLA
jgi:hypothetical protein